MTDNLVLELLRALRGDTGKLSDRVGELSHRISRLELAMAAMRQTRDRGGPASMGGFGRVLDGPRSPR